MNEQRPHRSERITELVRQKAALFFQYESTGPGLITVTRVTLSEDGKYATIFLTVLPETWDDKVLEYAKRKRSDFKAFIRDETSLARIPFFDFAIDNGERTRQRLDTIVV